MMVLSSGRVLSRSSEFLTPRPQQFSAAFSFLLQHYPVSQGLYVSAFAFCISPFVYDPHFGNLSMARGKKRPLGKNNDESANARFDNPFHKQFKYTTTSASATTLTINTAHQTRTVTYRPPSMPPIVEKIPESIIEEPAPSEPKQRTQASHLSPLYSIY